MRIRIIKELPWLFEKGVRYAVKPEMRQNFYALKGLKIANVSPLSVSGQDTMYGATVKTLRQACATQNQRSAASEWGKHWNSLGLVDSTIIGIPADCCCVLGEK